MSQKEQLAWYDSLIRLVYERNLQRIYDPKNAINYRVMEYSDIEESAQLMTKIFTEDNEFYKVCNVQATECVDEMRCSCKFAVEAGLGTIAKNASGSIVGATAGYSLTRMISNIQEKHELTDKYGAFAQILNMNQRLLENIQFKKYGDPSRFAMYDKGAVLQQYITINVIYMLIRMSEVIAAKRAYTHVCGIITNPLMLRYAAVRPGWQELYVLKTQGYTYKNIPIFNKLHEKGIKRIPFTYCPIRPY